MRKKIKSTESIRRNEIEKIKKELGSLDFENVNSFWMDINEIRDKLEEINDDAIKTIDYKDEIILRASHQKPDVFYSYDLNFCENSFDGKKLLEFRSDINLEFMPPNVPVRVLIGTEINREDVNFLLSSFLEALEDYDDLNELEDLMLFEKERLENFGDSKIDYDDFKENWNKN